ncbi:MAG: hypothetical protein ABIF17_04640 [Patescibacteria group bacterium]
MRKVFNIVMVLTVATMGLAGLITPAAQAVTAGTLIKTSSSSAVYYYDGAKRFVFPNQKTYYTWYGNDFSDVQVISMSEMGDIQLGGNIPYRAGTRMIKLNNDPKVYALEPGGVLRHVPSEAVATDLFGANWNKLIDDMPDSFFASTYAYGDALVADYPTGSLVKESGGATVYYIDGTEKRPVADESAFNANKFKWEDLRTHSLSAYTDGSSITGEESELTNPVGEDGSNVVSNGTLTVSIASDTPASTTYMSNQARAPFLFVNLVNNSTGDVVVDSLVIERGGLALDTDFSSVAVFESSVTGTQVGLNKTFNSDHRATVGDDITVKAGATKKLVIAGNMGTVNSGNAPKLGLYSMVLKGDATLSASLPIWGNVMSLNSSVTIAAAVVAAGGSNPTTDASPKVGDTNVDLTEIKVTNSSATEEIQVEKIVYKQAGTLADSDILSYSLYDTDGGVKLASAPQVDKYIEFNLTTPLKIGKSKNKELMLKADEINSGSSRTIQFDIYRNTDVVVKGLTYNAYVIPTFPASSQPYFDHTVDQTIGNGTLRVEPDSTFVAANIAEGQTGVQLGQWLFTVKGEGVDITNIEALLTITGDGTIGDITNGMFYNVETGNGLTGASDAVGGTGQTGGVSSTDTMSLPVGVHKIGLKADLSSDFSDGDTIVAGIIPTTYLTTTGVVTGNAITETPATAQNSSTMTIQTASIAVSMSNSPAAQTVIAGTTGLEVANVQLDGSSSGDDITVTQLKTVIRTSGMNPAELSILKIYDGATELTLTGTSPDPTSTDAGSVTTTWNFSPALKITKGTVKTLKIKANVASTPTSAEWFKFGLQSGCTVTAKDSSNEDAAKTYSYTDGQAMTIASAGVLTLSRSDSYTSGFLTGNSTGLVIGKFRASATYEDVNIEKLYVDIASYNGGGRDELGTLYLYDGATQVAQVYVTNTDNEETVLFNMSSNPVKITNGTEKELTLKVDSPVISKVTGIGTNANPVDGYTLSIVAGSTRIIAKGVSGQLASITSSTLSFPSYAMVKSQPTITLSSTGDKVSSSNPDLIDVTITADAKGPIGLYKMAFKVTTSTVSASDFQMYEGTTLVATENSTATHGINVSYIDDDGSSPADYTLVQVYFNTASALGGQLREIPAGESKTYTLKTSLSGYTTTGSVSTCMLGDDALASAEYDKNAVAVDALDDDDFIWSDLAFGNTTTTATTTIEWLNGYYVKGDLLTTTSSPKSLEN